jgi:hypothetical protein
MVVHYNNFCLDCFGGLQYGVQALLQEVFDIVVDYDYRKGQ